MWSGGWLPPPFKGPFSTFTANRESIVRKVGGQLSGVSGAWLLCYSVVTGHTAVTVPGN